MVTFTGPFRASFRQTFLLGYTRGRRRAVVATVSASANADRDNGTALHGMARMALSWVNAVWRVFGGESGFTQVIWFMSSYSMLWSA
jgi:hypothetical protein